MENRCVCCGADIPEGRIICPNCESQINNENEDNV
jgi:predicted amidophosphoribosyltransferase